MDLRPCRATSQIGKSRRNGEAAMRVLRNWASQGAGSRSLFICTEIYRGHLSTRGPHLGLGPSVDGRAVHGAVLYGARQKRAKWSELENGESTGQQQLGIRRHSSRGLSPSSRTECSSVFRSREATAPAEGSARVSTSSSAQLPPAAASDKSATAAPQYGTTTTASSAARAGNNFAVAHSPAATLPRRHLRHYSVWCDSPASCHTPRRSWVCSNAHPGAAF